MTLRVVRALLLVCVAGLLSACTAPAMKGTPFFKGDYNKAEGELEDRVNLWPLVYYRRPALSVLWPVGEFSDEHVAVRPLFSVYGLDKEQRRVKILSPVCSLDFRRRRYHVLPAFWGNPPSGAPYFVLFPLIWHSRGNHFGVFPLLLRYTRPEGKRVHALWPIFHRKTGEGEQGWRIWPFYGHYYREDATRRYALWPLAMSLWDKDKNVRWAAPLYLGKRRPGLAWDLLLPLLYSYRSDEEKRLAIFPAFYRSSDDKGNWTWLSPLYMGQKKQDSRWDSVVPVYFHSTTPEGRKTLVLPVYYGARKGEEKKTLLFPLFYHWTDGNAYMLLMPPGGITKSAGRRTFHAFPLLSAYSTSPEANDLWALFPLTHWRWKDGIERSHVFPLYYWDRTEGTFFSLLFSLGTRAPKRFVNVLGPLVTYAWHTEKPGHWALNLFWPFAEIRRSEGKLAHRLFPLWMYSSGKDRKHLNVGLLLADYESRPDKKEWWVLARLLAGGESRKDHNEHHVRPFYSYRDHEGRKQLLLGSWLGDASLVGAKWGDKDAGFWVFPLFYNKSEKSRSWQQNKVDYRMDVRHRSFVAFPLVFYEHQLPQSDTLVEVVGDERRPVKPHKGLRMPKARRNMCVLPLWGYERKGEPDEEAKGEGEKTFWILASLYDYKKKVTPREDAPEERDVYKRRRVLWRLLHYERLNDASSLDVFPGITYDSAPGKKTFSFLWRVIRYESDRDKGKKLHLLFIPFGGGRKPTPAPEPG